MSRFTGEDPVGKYLSNGVDFMLLEPLEFFVSKEENVGESIIVYKGFVTDFASVPRIIQLFLPKSIGRRAAIIHDYLYRSLGMHGRYTRKQCDLIFLDALEVLKVRKTRRMALYFGVRLGGWVPWGKINRVFPCILPLLFLIMTSCSYDAVKKTTYADRTESSIASFSFGTDRQSATFTEQGFQYETQNQSKTAMSAIRTIGTISTTAIANRMLERVSKNQTDVSIADSNNATKEVLAAEKTKQVEIKSNEAIKTTEILATEAP